jgi:YebC/PmpR family DNA-binding regulatory protein
VVNSSSPSTIRSTRNVRTFQWATIKHKKGAADAKRGRVFTKLIREMTIASRIGGGDPDSNPRLRTAVAQAKQANMPADNIKRAIQKGRVSWRGASYEDLTLEGYGPGGVALLIEGTNRQPQSNGLRDPPHHHRSTAGNLGSVGSVSYMFKPKGFIAMPPSKTDEEKLMEIALEAGAEDIKSEGDFFEVYTTQQTYEAVLKAAQGCRARARPVRGRQVRGHEITPRGPEGPADAEASRDARGPRRRPEGLGQLRYLREGDGGRGRR